MKIKFITISLVVIALCLVTSCTAQQKKIEVYSFSGENDFVEINNGIIIITDELEKFIGGDLSFKGDELSDVKYSVTKFYFYKDGAETVIQNNVVSIEGTSEGENISPDMGSSSSTTLFNAEDWSLIKKSLNFSLSGLFMNGESFEYNIVLEVKEVY